MPLPLFGVQAKILNKRKISQHMWLGVKYFLTGLLNVLNEILCIRHILLFGILQIFGESYHGHNSPFHSEILCYSGFCHTVLTGLSCLSQFWHLYFLQLSPIGGYVPTCQPSVIAMGINIYTHIFCLSSFRLMWQTVSREFLCSDFSPVSVYKIKLSSNRKCFFPPRFL